MSATKNLIREDILKLNRQFYRSIEDWDLETMSSLWLNAPHVVCIHPGWEAIQGYGQVVDSWTVIFNSRQVLSFRLENVQIYDSDTLAVVTLVENLLFEQEGKASSTSIPATNVFIRVKDEWKMILHHASPAL